MKINSILDSYLIAKQVVYWNLIFEKEGAKSTSPVPFCFLIFG
jgi:hypothetical protein